MIQLDHNIFQMGLKPHNKMVIVFTNKVDGSEILHQLVCSFSHSLQRFIYIYIHMHIYIYICIYIYIYIRIYPRWCRISEPSTVSRIWTAFGMIFATRILKNGCFQLRSWSNWLYKSFWDGSPHSHPHPSNGLTICQLIYNDDNHTCFNTHLERNHCSSDSSMNSIYFSAIRRTQHQHQGSFLERISSHQTVFVLCHGFFACDMLPGK